MSSDNQFDTIVGEHYEPLFRFALQLTRTEADAKDLTQQTFYVWAIKGHQLRDSSKVKTWLFTTLRNAFLQDCRRETRYIHEDLEKIADELPAASPELGHSGDYSEVAFRLAKVDDVYRSALSLYYLNDCSYHEIAMLLDVPLGTVKSRIARGLAQLREILAMEDVTIPLPVRISPVRVNRGFAHRDDIHELLPCEDRPAYIERPGQGNESSTLLAGTSSRQRRHISSPPQFAADTQAKN